MRLASAAAAVLIATTSLRAAAQESQTVEPTSGAPSQAAPALPRPSPKPAPAATDHAASARPTAGAPSSASAPPPAASPAKAAPDRTPPRAARVAKDEPASGAPSGDSAESGAKPQRQETLAEIVARVRRRLVTEARPRSGPASRGPTSAAHGASEPARVPPRVSLVWRPVIVWPAELVRPAAPAAVSTPHVTLSWDSLP